MSVTDAVKAFSTRRATRLGANSVLIVLLVAGILVIVNFLAARHSTRWDFSETQRFTLAPQTYQVLRGLTRDVTVTVFSQDRSPAQTQFRELLDEYQRVNDKLKVQYVDPDRNPALAKQYGITRRDIAVVESQTESARATVPAESDLTSAIVRVSKDVKKTVRILEGHGERGINDQDRGGLSVAKDALTKQGYEVESLSLLTRAEVPSGTAVLIIPGPQRALTDDEVKRIEAYIASGGHVMILIDPDTDPHLAPLLASWGITPGEGLLVDLQDSVAQIGAMALLLRPGYDHDITRDISSYVIFPLSRALIVKEDGEAAKQWSVAPLARTSARSWAETSLKNAKSGVIRFDEKEDARGPLPFAVAITPKKAPEAGKPRPAIVVVGNSQFVTNAYLNFPGNTDFLLHAIGWLAEDRDLIAITPKENAFRPFIPNPTQERVLLYVQVLLLPATIFFWGLSIWRRRRRL
ncbi:MAG TPA: DUF4350 domain-containing protein [Nitrospirales bacterium]|nr:DUF4350 domain-containing protein [Nitrospirales bacterium]